LHFRAGSRASPLSSPRDTVRPSARDTARRTLLGASGLSQHGGTGTACPEGSPSITTTDALVWTVGAEGRLFAFRP
jgi:hypothetical protein